MISLVRPPVGFWLDFGLSRKLIINHFFSSFTVPVFKTMSTSTPFVKKLRIFKTTPKINLKT